MDPKQWGPGIWKFVHTVSFNFDPSGEVSRKIGRQKYIKQYRDFFINFVNVLPCQYCRSSAKSFIGIPDWETKKCEFPIDRHPVSIDGYVRHPTKGRIKVLGSREGLSYWAYLLHNKVNRKLKKKSESYRRVKRRYLKYRTVCKKKNWIKDGYTHKPADC